MKVVPSQFTVAEYCSQMTDNKIRINRDYQRSSKVWPPAARSYFIDTMLKEFPVPKLSLYQKTDIKTRVATKEIVDGQQRSQAILDFYNNKLRLTNNSPDFKGFTFETLPNELRKVFLEYPLAVDVFVSATDQDIRELFRRINSYNVPLNPQEKRHAIRQGAFKWFILEMCENYSQVLKDIGTFNESNIARMEDAKFLSDLCQGIIYGIESASERKLDRLYEARDQKFIEEGDLRSRLSELFNIILGWQALHRGPLMKRYHLYSLFLAISHCLNPISALTRLFVNDRANMLVDVEYILPNLSLLGEIAEGEVIEPSHPMQSFYLASLKTTDRKAQREARFVWFCKALTSKSI